MSIQEQMEAAGFTAEDLKRNPWLKAVLRANQMSLNIEIAKDVEAASQPQPDYWMSDEVFAASYQPAQAALREWGVDTEGTIFAFEDAASFRAFAAEVSAGDAEQEARIHDLAGHSTETVLELETIVHIAEENGMTKEEVVTLLRPVAQMAAVEQRDVHDKTCSDKALDDHKHEVEAAEDKAIEEVEKALEAEGKCVDIKGQLTCRKEAKTHAPETVEYKGEHRADTHTSPSHLEGQAQHHQDDIRYAL